MKTVNKTYHAGQQIECPHCGKEQEGPAEDHVVLGAYGKINHPYENDCGWCDKLYSVTKQDDGMYKVSPMPGMR